MGCGRSIPEVPAESPAPSPAPAPATATTGPTLVNGTNANQKILDLGNGQTFDIFEDGFNIEIFKRALPGAIGPEDKYVIKFNTNITSNTHLNNVTVKPAIKIIKNSTLIYNEEFPLKFGPQTTEFIFDKNTLQGEDIIKVEFTFSIYTKLFEKKLVIIELAEGFRNVKPSFNIKGYSEENPLLGKLYSPY